MADGGAVLFDRPFSLPRESQGKVNSLTNRQFVDPREFERNPFLDDFRPKQKHPKELLPHIPVLDERPTETGPVDFDRTLFMQSKETLEAPPKQTEKPVLPLPEPKPLELAEIKPEATGWQIATPQSADTPPDKPIIGIHRTSPKAEVGSVSNAR